MTNPLDAASALAMAQKLMKEYQISQEDVEITTKESETLFARRTPMYIHKLLRVICLAFGCEGYLSKWDKAKVREAGNTRDGDFSGLQGYLDGKNVKLNHGVSGTEAMKLTGGM